MAVWIINQLVVQSVSMSINSLSINSRTSDNNEFAPESVL